MVVLPNMCRLCLTCDKNGLELFKRKKGKESYADLFMTSFDIELKRDDRYPKTACRNCLKHLKKMVKFKNTVIASQQQLSQICSDLKIIGDRDPVGEDRNCKEAVPLPVEPELKIVAVRSLKRVRGRVGSEDESSSEEDSDAAIGCEEVPAAMSAAGPPKRTRYVNNNNNLKKLTEEEQMLDRMLYEMDLLKCHKCMRGDFKSFQELHVHTLKTHAKEKGQVRCCGKIFQSYTPAFDHMRYHRDPNAFKCKVCMKLFSCGRVLSLHMDVHVDPKEFPFKCDLCGEKFLKKNKLNYHVKSHIPVSERPFKCPHCDDRFINQSKLKTHIKVMHEGPIRQECDICGKHVYYLFYHKRRMHMDRPKARCDICGKNVAQHNMKNHLDAHKEDYSCKLCGKQYLSSVGLKNHMQKHSGVKLKCHFCSYKSSTQIARNAHQRRMHPEELAEWHKQPRENWKRLKYGPKSRVKTN